MRPHVGGSLLVESVVRAVRHAQECSRCIAGRVGAAAMRVQTLDRCDSAEKSGPMPGSDIQSQKRNIVRRSRPAPAPKPWRSRRCRPPSPKPVPRNGGRRSCRRSPALRSARGTARPIRRRNLSCTRRLARRSRAAVAISVSPRAAIVSGTSAAADGAITRMDRYAAMIARITGRKTRPALRKNSVLVCARRASASLR